MGHKGVSKRKPKKDNSLPNVNTPARDDSPVQTLMKNNDTAPNNGNSNPGGANKKNKKGK